MKLTANAFCGRQLVLGHLWTAAFPVGTATDVAIPAARRLRPQEPAGHDGEGTTV
ncbi:hypothetical protein [Nakamurella leprariae]|uniref:Uncharacterized protein n=1 Tax=Nakamurella leprariae TaxID=2803911 RepID=A0A938YCX4_9ACTN|nr:hypothetical protein [Nakamurella leprariae]MBM9467308.1 hypothetical protein [Nakamurella leprariae]